MQCSYVQIFLAHGLYRKQVPQVILVMGRVWDPMDYIIFKVLTVQLKGLWFSVEGEPNSAAHLLSNCFPLSSTLNDSLLQQG